MSADDRTRELLERENDELKSRIAALDAEARRYKGSLQEAEDAAHLGGWDWDAVNDEITGSEEFYRLFDVAPEGLAKFSQFVEQLHPDDRERVQQDVADALKQDKPYDTDYRVKLSDGGWRDLIARGRVFADADGKAVRMVGTCLDITERKRADAELRESERRYRTLAESLPHLVWTCRGDGPCDYLSPRWVDYTGIPEAEQLGYGWLDQLHPDDRERVVAEWSEGAPRGDVFDIEFRIRRADGMHRWFKTRAIPFRDDAGGVVKWFGSNTDIDDYKRAYEALRNSEERQRATLRSIGDGVVSTDAAGYVAQMNPVAEALTGWIEAEAKSKPVAEVFRIINEDTRAEVESPVPRVLREGAVVGLANHTLLIAKDGTERLIADSGAPIRNDRGETTGVVLVFRDQTEERAAQNAVLESEARFRSVFENSPLGKSMTDIAGGLRVNQSFASLLGYSKDEICSMAWQEITHPDDIQQSADVTQSLLSGEKDQVRLEQRYIHKSGRVVWTDAASALHRDQHGKPLFLITTISDTTERNAQEAKVRRERDLYTDLVNALPIGVYRICVQPAAKWSDETWRDQMASTYSVEFASDRFCEILGITRQQFEANPGIIPDIVHPEDQADFARLNTAAVLSISVFSWEGRVMVGGERIAWIRFSSVPRPIGGGEVVWSGVVADITEHKLAEQEILALNAGLEQRVRDRTTQLEASNQELEAFSYSVSHDLRAPLRAIDGFTRMLAEDYAPQFDAEGKRVCSVIHENTVRMSRLIDDLLAFSRLGRTEMSLSRIDMGAMANAVFYELTTPESRARIEFQVGTVPKAFADTTLMRQVWMNLLSNAIKFSSKRERATIQVSAEQIQGEMVYTVKDNGAGFDMQYVQKLFGVFQRLHSTKDFEGTGVGLALVQRVIRRHGGRVWAKGEVDKGATLYFSLQHGGA